ncbi:hypothetical protein [Allosphingosinicella sp.]|jgi:hypothetical protein|uniref:hypothetical protein n=1 Tax=Allosphingosinicella sp. TaxID=2823234 RepID=UPI002EE384FB
MRDILSKVMTGSMIAGAALLVVACGSTGNNAANNTAANDLNTTIAPPAELNTTTDLNAVGGTDMNGSAGGTDMNVSVDGNAGANVAVNTQ